MTANFPNLTTEVAQLDAILDHKARQRETEGLRLFSGVVREYIGANAPGGATEARACDRTQTDFATQFPIYPAGTARFSAQWAQYTDGVLVKNFDVHVHIFAVDETTAARALVQAFGRRAVRLIDCG